MNETVGFWEYIKGCWTYVYKSRKYYLGLKHLATFGLVCGGLTGASLPALPAGAYAPQSSPGAALPYASADLGAPYWPASAYGTGANAPGKDLTESPTKPTCCPEPASAAVFLVGLVAFAFFRQRLR